MSAFTRGVLSLARTIHIYATMLTVALLLFFAATGFMLVNSEWFGLDKTGRTETKSISLPKELFATPDPGAIELKLREALGSVGLRDALEVEETEIRVIFKRPGMTTTAIIDRTAGEAKITKEIRGPLALLSELHKNSQTGRRWRYVLDSAAIVLGLACVTGLLLCFIPKTRRRLGFTALLLGAAACVAAYYMLA